MGRALGVPVNAGDAVTCDGEFAVGVMGLRGYRLAAIARLLEVRAVVVAGVAGGLDPRLKIGDVVVDGADGEMIAGLRGAGFFFGRVHTADALVATAGEKAALFAKTGALAVDMETELVREMAAKMGVPFLALRVISDTAQDGLDPALVNLIDSLGRPRVMRAAVHVMANPGKMPAMMQVGRNMRCALSRLGLAIDAVVASKWPGAAGGQSSR